MAKKPYYDLPGFQHVYLEDSYVLAIRESLDRIEVDLDVVLRREHPEYQEPAQDEQYCYRRAQLTFPDMTSVQWLVRQFKPAKDASGAIDYGNIDALIVDNGRYEMSGEWGAVRVVSGRPELKIL